MIPGCVWEGCGVCLALTSHLKKSLALTPPLKTFFQSKNGKIWPKNGIFLKYFGQPSRFSQICCKISWPPPRKIFDWAHVWLGERTNNQKVVGSNPTTAFVRWSHTLRVIDFCCNKVRRCLWNKKSLLEEIVSMRAGKLKARWDFGQGNKFRSCRQPKTSKSRLGSQYMVIKWIKVAKWDSLNKTQSINKGPLSPPPPCIFSFCAWSESRLGLWFSFALKCFRLK